MSCTNLKWVGEIRYISSNSEKIPEAGGMYKILRNDGEKGKLTRVYIGKAVNLRSQYNFHLSSSEENECLSKNVRNNECYFKYALLDGEQSRQEAEDHLLSLGTYKCNTQGQ